MCVIFRPRALDDIANLHIGRAATSQRLQLMQYFSASSYSAPLSDADARHPARLVLALDSRVHPAHRAGGGADGALNAVFELVSFIVGLLRVGQSVERHVNTDGTNTAAASLGDGIKSAQPEPMANRFSMVCPACDGRSAHQWLHRTAATVAAQKNRPYTFTPCGGL